MAVTARRRTSQQVLEANCGPGDLLGDAVYVSGAVSGGKYTVSKVDIDQGQSPESVTVGVIILKPGTTNCLVQLDGVIQGLYAGLTPGSRMFVGDSSQLIEGAPSRPLVGRRIVQEVGYALSDDTILINPKLPVRTRAV